MLSRVTADGVSVIHAGELMPRDIAFKLMLEEFTPFGYTRLTIERFIQKAFLATQNFLGNLSWQSDEIARSQLNDALAQDTKRALYWRSQSVEARQAHAKKFADEEAAQAERIRQKKAKLEKERLEQIADRGERIRQMEAELQKRYQQERKEQAFEVWQRHNESGGWKANAPERAKARLRDDQAKYDAILARCDTGWTLVAQLCPPRKRGATQNAMLNALSDHSYIELMFDCYSRATNFDGQISLQ